MNSPRISFDEEAQLPIQTIKEQLTSIFNFCMQVLLFLGSFIAIASLVLYIIHQLNHLSVQIACPVNKTYPFNYELFLRNASSRG